MIIENAFLCSTQISLSTNFTSDEQFKAVVTVNLTAMLVIVTLFISDAKRYTTPHGIITMTMFANFLCSVYQKLPT